MFWAKSVPRHVCHIKSSFPGSPRNRNSLMVYTHRAFVSVSFKHRISYTLFWNLLMSLLVPRRSFQTRPQRSLPPLLQWLQNVPFCAYARVVEVFVAPRWASLYAWEMRAVVPQVLPSLASPFLKTEMYIEGFQSANHRFVFRICGHILVRILTIHSLWREINLSLFQLL